jgi:PAS domain S-box-containing protein
MSKPLRILIVEDSADDAALLLRELTRGGYAPVHQRVETADDMRVALERLTWDIIASDWTMPRFSAFAALELLTATGLDLPFLVISGTVDEETAVAALKAGAHDYLSKNKLGRLIPAIERELRDGEARRARKRAEEMFHLVVEAAPTGITIVDHEGAIQLVNVQTERLFGYTRSELLGQSIEMLIPERFRQQHESHRAKFFQAPSPRVMGAGRDLRGLRKDGKEFPVEIGLSPVKTSDGVQVMASIIDITERKRTQETLQKTHDQLTALIQASPMGITVLDPDGRVQLWNPAAERIYGWREDEVLGRPLPTIPPDKQDEHRSFCRQVLDGHAFTTLEVVRRRKDGSLIDISLSTAALKDARGRVIGILGIMADITEHKLMERRAGRLEELATLGQLLGGVAHELKNPLFILLGRLQLVLEKLHRQKYDTLEADLGKIEDAAQRMTAITQRFLNFAKPHAAKNERCAINLAVQKTMDFLSNELMKNHIRLITSLHPTLRPVWCDERELQQVFTNLVMNAVYAMAKAKGHGTLTISTVPHEETVEIRIRDDGPGIAPEHRDKLFDPFFTTKPANEGTGLGLWIVRTLIVGMKGTIDCETEMGKGTTFTVRLPISTGQESRARAEQDATRPGSE